MICTILSDLGLSLKFVDKNVLSPRQVCHQLGTTESPSSPAIIIGIKLSITIHKKIECIVIRGHLRITSAFFFLGGGGHMSSNIILWISFSLPEKY